MSSLKRIIIRFFLLFFSAYIFVACQQKIIHYSKIRNTTESYAHLNDSTLSISGISTDVEFGYTELKPIMLGIFNVHKGAENVEKYFNALLGSNGEDIQYKRLKPCCPFKTKNFTYERPIPIMGNVIFDGKYGMLEKYSVEYGNDGNKKLYVLYFNLYDEAKELLAPSGFTYKK